MLGGVNAIEAGFLVVNKGGWFSRDVRIPTDSIAAHTDTRIDLDLTADEVSRHAWEPTDEREPASEAVVGSAPDAPPTDESRISAVDDFETVHVPIVEEQLDAVKRTVERGDVRVTSTVTEHDASLSVPVTEERVRIQRVAVDRPATATDLAAYDRVVEVPIYGEDVEATTQARVVEEVVIAKDAIEETRDLSGTMTRHDVVVTDETTSDVHLPSGDTPRLLQEGDERRDRGESS